jgi:hypothetical protein
MFSGAIRPSKRLRVGVTLFACALAGCNRFHYRQQADTDVAGLVEEKSYDPRWAREPGFSVDMDPRSRFYEPYVQECPPMPPDDPDSHQLMHCIYGKTGWKRWHDNGDRPELESPSWRESLSSYTRPGKDGAILLGLDDAVRIGLINSSTYQQQIETLYLSALDVSSERFAFDTQFFGGVDGTYQHLGDKRAGGEANSFTLGRTAPFSSFNIAKRAATAGTLLVGFANSFVWQFAGNDSDNATTLLNFSLVQPLLRNGGRVIGLERLTLAERVLLANVRAFEQYRQGFYTNVAIGNLGVQGPQRRGGFSGDSGLSGFTGLGTTGFSGVGDANLGRGGIDGGGGGGSAGAVIGLAGGGAGNVGGFIGQLQRLQQIRNNEDSLNLQLRTLALLEANLDAGLIDIAQVDQFRQSIETQRATLLQNRNGLQSQLDTFKVLLGLPPNVELDLDDSLIRRFQLIDRQVTDMQNDVSEFIRRIGDLPADPDLPALQEALSMFEEFHSRSVTLFTLTRQDLDQLDRAAKVRQDTLAPDARADFERDRQRLSENLIEVRDRFEKMRDTLSGLKNGLTPDTRRKTADQFVALLVDLQDVLGELSLIQARARLEQVSVTAIDLDAALALEIARSNRLDWMNNRSALVDTWRLIEFNANRLESNFSIFFDGDVSTLGNNPLAFRGPTGRLRAGFQFDPPLTRLIERNNFRAQLISYQQARRQLVIFEDSINTQMRNHVRNLNQHRLNLEIQRRAVAIAIRRVDQTREALNKPVPPADPGAAQAQFGPTAAQNLLSAVSALSDAQNNFMSVWLAYESTRMQLMRDLGVMQINDHGLWIDEPFDVIKARVCPDQFPMPPDVPAQWLQQVAPEPAPPKPAAAPTASKGIASNSQNRRDDSRNRPSVRPPFQGREELLKSKLISRQHN